MQDHLKAFGVEPLPPVVETSGKGLSLQVDISGVKILVGRETVVEELPLVEWLVAAGNVLLFRGRSSLTPLYFGPESEEEAFIRVTEDIYYVADLAAIYQCFLQNPVEAYCIYDNAIELNDEESLHPIAVALGLSHPRGLEALGFSKSEHAEVFEEADFFKSVVTQKRPDLSLLVSLQNAWQKQQGRDIKIAVSAGIIRLSKA